MSRIISELAATNAVRDKIDIRRAYAPAQEVGRKDTPFGDDCAAIPESGGGYLLFAAEGLIESFVRDDPWFAGYSAVMVNISDISAMGGRPTAIVDVIWTPCHKRTEKLWDGMRQAARDYGVPIVGGHTTISRGRGDVHLAAAVVGRANRLMTSFDAKPADALLMVVDLNGSYRGDKPFWNASVDTPSARIRDRIELLPRLAESGMCSVAKDISNGGIIGTLIMLLECSAVGAELNLDELPIPPGVELPSWLKSFPSYGYLFSMPRRYVDSVIDEFSCHDLCCRTIGQITAEQKLVLTLGNEQQEFWRPSTDVSTYASAQL